MTLADLVHVPSYERDGPRLAEALLRRATLVAGDARFAVDEVELYCWRDEHEDPFAHRHDAQRVPGRWYFHRQGPSYRGGSYKGLDLTFGPGHGGCLIRTITLHGARVSGPSKCVDALLAHTGFDHVAALDAVASPFDVDAPLHLEDTAPRELDVLRTARVGLTLKRAAAAPTMTRFVMRPDRFVADPRIPKGRVQTAIALHARGLSPDAIAREMGGARAHVARWVAAYERGRASDDFTPFIGTDPRGEALAHLHGAWDARYG